MYSRLHDNIRTVDDDHILFFEKSTVNIIGSSGFDSGPGGPNYNDRQAYSYHIYCGSTDENGDPYDVAQCDGEEIIFFFFFWKFLEYSFFKNFFL